jgi:hypothetical protein
MGASQRIKNHAKYGVIKIAERKVLYTTLGILLKENLQPVVPEAKSNPTTP